MCMSLGQTASVRKSSGYWRKLLAGPCGRIIWEGRESSCYSCYYVCVAGFCFLGMVLVLLFVFLFAAYL